MSLPQISLRRTLLIAQRDFYGYVKTWGFWISFFMPFIFGALGVIFATIDLDVSLSPVKYETIIDETGKHGPVIIHQREDRQKRTALALLDEVGVKLLPKADVNALKARIETDGIDAARSYIAEKYPGIEDKIPNDKTVIVPPPANSLEDLKPYLRGEKTIIHDKEEVKLNGVLHIFDEGGLKVNYWSENFTNPAMEGIASSYFKSRAKDAYLATGGLTSKGLSDAQRAVVDVGIFDPSKTNTGQDESQAVTNIDRIPLMAAVVMSGFLWLTIFSGAYMLLTSMLEEKTNKLLEMMLASCRISEVMFGKLLGVAALTITAMLPYIIICVGGVIAAITLGPDDVSAGLLQAFPPKMIFFFLLYLVLGYVFYGSFFIALGALSESMQDAQTLTTPIILVLTACIMVVPLGLNAPDSPLLTFAAWFPLSSPFAAIIRLASDPPWWELVISALFLLVCTVGVVWLAGRILKFGALSGAGAQAVKTWFKRVVLRRKSA